MKSQNLMNFSRARVYFTVVFLAAAVCAGAQRPPKPDELVELNDVTLRTGAGKWLQATVSFTPRKHPNPDTAYNEEFIDDAKLSLYLCFRNKTREDNFRKEGRKINKDYVEADLYDYFYAEVEILTMKVDNNRKELHFLLPGELAERDGFDRVVKPVGHVVEMTIGGKQLEFKEAVEFDKYREPGILAKFKEFAQSKSKGNAGLLFPAHLISANYLENAPAVKISQSSNASDL